MKTKTIMITMFLFFGFCHPVFALTQPALSIDLVQAMPAQVQGLLEQGKNWNVLEFHKLDNRYVMLLEGDLKEKKTEDEQYKRYLLLQVQGSDWASVKGQIWTLPSAQGTSFGIVPVMQVTEDAIWLQFWNEGTFLISRIDPDGKIQEKEFVNGLLPTPALSQHGVVGYDTTQKALVFWDGQNETVYPVQQAANQIARAAELDHTVFYLDTAGNFHRITQVEDQILFNLQSYEQDQQTTERIDYIESLNLFYCNNALWMSAGDWRLPSAPLVQYQNDTTTVYPIVLGEIYHCTAQQDGSVQLLFDSYSPGDIPFDLIGIIQEQQELCTIQGKDVTERSEYTSGQGLPYLDQDNMLWHYQLQDQQIWFTHTLQDGTTIGYGSNFSTPSIRVLLNEQEYYFDEPPYLKGNRTLVPLRAIASLLGATVQWKDNTVILQKGERTIRLKEGESMAFVNQKAVQMDTTPENKNGRIMVPLRFIAEGFQTSVQWEQQTIKIVS